LTEPGRAPQAQNSDIRSELAGKSGSQRWIPLRAL